MVTMRTYAEAEKLFRNDRAAADLAAHRRPDHHWQVPGRPCADRLDARRDVIYVAILFYYGNPEWKPIIAGVCGTSASWRMFPGHGTVRLQLR